MNDADRAAFGRVESAVRLSRYGGDCYAYCMLAAGHVDLVIETELKPYDIAPADPDHHRRRRHRHHLGGQRPAATGGRIVAAGDKRVHAAALAAEGLRADDRQPNSGVPGTKASNAARTWPRKRSCSISSLVARTRAR